MLSYHTTCTQHPRTTRRSGKTTVGEGLQSPAWTLKRAMHIAHPAHGGIVRSTFRSFRTGKSRRGPAPKPVLRPLGNPPLTVSHFSQKFSEDFMTRKGGRKKGREDAKSFLRREANMST